MTMLNSFCCCVPLRRECLVLSILKLMISILGVISSFIVICASSPTDNLYENLAYSGLSFMCCTISLIFSSILLHGVLKSKAGFVMAYIAFYLVCSAMAMMMIFRAHFLFTFWYGAPAFLVSIIVEVIVCGITIYILFFLYSYYLVLKKDEQKNVQYECNMNLL